MTRKLYKHKLLLDESFPVRVYLRKLNALYDVKHVSGDLHKDGIRDGLVYELAQKLGRLIITHNDRDFRPFAEKSNKTGVVGVSQNLKPEQIDTKLVAFLKKQSPQSLYGAFHYISGES
jgi:predicted nuclease of predicted toxin-antitoxin system